MAQNETDYPTLYHITFQEDWEKAKAAGVYTADSLQQVGFIHLSTDKQWRLSASRFYKGKTGLVLLQIVATKLSSPLKYEIAHADEPPFPHLFGTLNLDSVEHVHQLKEDEATGNWSTI